RGTRPQIDADDPGARLSMRRGFDLVLIIVCGLILGAIVHLIVVLRVPAFAERDAYARLSAATRQEKAQLLSGLASEIERMPMPDPAVAVAVCSFDLTK